MNNARLIEEAKALFSVVEPQMKLDAESIVSAKEMFCDYKEKRIILEGDFQEDKWMLSDEYSHQGIDFSTNSFAYKKFYEKATGYPVEEFKDYLKTYIIFCIGKLTIRSLISITNAVKKIIKYDIGSIEQGALYEIDIPMGSGDFFSILPFVDTKLAESLCEFIYDAAEGVAERNMKRYRRQLCDFQTYFIFDEYISRFWAEETDIKTRLFFYPLYLWWKITGVIPTRPREFILTPRDCLATERGQAYVILRKTRLKGCNEGIAYNIEQDYVKVRFPIPDNLAKEVREYIDLTESFGDNELHTLFRTEPHYQKFDQKVHTNSRYLTYCNLRTILRLFYQEILEKRYGIEVNRYRGSIIHENSIEYINLGDTRHISMINAILEGGSPEIVMQLAGHDSIDMSSHYFANIRTLVECRTYRRYLKHFEGKSDYVVGKNFYSVEEPLLFTSLSETERCFSAPFAAGDIKDCQCAVGPNGELGYCPECLYYRRNDAGFFVMDKNLFLSNLEQDVKYLRMMVKKVRASMGYEEDIKEAILRLQSSSYNYAAYYAEQLKKGEYINGKTEEN